MAPGRPAEYLFSPREAMAEFRAGQRRARTTPLYPSQWRRGAEAEPQAGARGEVLDPDL